MIGEYVCIGWVDVSWMLVSNIFWGLELGFHSEGVCVYIHSGLYMGCVVGVFIQLCVHSYVGCLG